MMFSTPPIISSTAAKIARPNPLTRSTVTSSIPRPDHGSTSSRDPHTAHVFDHRGMTPAHGPGSTNADGGDIANATGADSRYAIRTERDHPEPSSPTVIASSCAFAPVHTCAPTALG